LRPCGSKVPKVWMSLISSLFLWWSEEQSIRTHTDISSKECPTLLKCCATGEFALFSIMSRRCSTKRSPSRLLVSPMYTLAHERHWMTYTMLNAGPHMWMALNNDDYEALKWYHSSLTKSTPLICLLKSNSKQTNTLSRLFSKTQRMQQLLLIKSLLWQLTILKSTRSTTSWKRTGPSFRLQVDSAIVLFYLWETMQT
jgi:hypothetical protein